MHASPMDFLLTAMVVVVAVVVVVVVVVVAVVVVIVGFINLAAVTLTHLLLTARSPLPHRQ
jgi:hypothetical protein